jgi:uncharacterized glyoxalase superfamily protein PhnB
MISQIIAKIPFISKAETIAYYQKLGFDFVADNNSELHFFEFKALDPSQSDFMLYFKISNDIETFFEQVQNKNIAIHPNGSLETKPWGMKEFSLLDPNGTLLTFGERI